MNMSLLRSGKSCGANMLPIAFSSREAMSVITHWILVVPKEKHLHGLCRAEFGTRAVVVQLNC